MNKAIKLSFVAAAIAVISACGNAEQKSAPVALETDQQKQSYALGASMGKYLKTTLERNEEMGIQLEQPYILSGIEDALGAQLQLDDNQIDEVMRALESKMRELAQKKADADAKVAKQAGVDFLAENAKREGVIVTESGLQYEVITAADGEKPRAVDTVEVHYHGTLVDGTVFDSSVERDKKISFPLNGVIPGWTEGLQHMAVGSKYKFYIPSNLGYGARPAGKIPPHSTLIFEVELFGIERADTAN